MPPRMPSMAGRRSQAQPLLGCPPNAPESSSCCGGGTLRCAKRASCAKPQVSAICCFVTSCPTSSPVQDKGKVIDKSKHHVLTAAHPSGLSAHRGFFGCKHFSQANALLEQQGQAPIDWQIE